MGSEDSSIAGGLAQSYAAPVETINADALELIQSWTDLHLLKLQESEFALALRWGCWRSLRIAARCNAPIARTRFAC